MYDATSLFQEPEFVIPYSHHTFSTPNESRTHNLRIRSALLYPIELWGHVNKFGKGSLLYLIVAVPLGMSLLCVPLLLPYVNQNSYDGGTNHQRPLSPFSFVPVGGLEPPRALLLKGFSYLL